MNWKLLLLVKNERYLLGLFDTLILQAVIERIEKKVERAQPYLC